MEDDDGMMKLQAVPNKTNIFSIRLRRLLHKNDQRVASREMRVQTNTSTCVHVE